MKRWQKFAIVGGLFMVIAAARNYAGCDAQQAVPAGPDAGAMMATPVTRAIAPPVHNYQAIAELAEPLDTAPFTESAVTAAEYEAIVQINTLRSKKRRALIAAQETLDDAELIRLLDVVDAEADAAYREIFGDRLEPLVRGLQTYGETEALPALAELINEATP